MSEHQERIRLRGHHLYCCWMIDLEGDPIYNALFCANFREYQQRLKADPKTVVEVVRYCGDTCVYCPSWNASDDKCILYDYAPDANRIDLEILKPLGLNPGDVISAAELRQKIKDSFGLDAPDICTWGCGLGWLLQCDEGRRKLHSS